MSALSSRGVVWQGAALLRAGLRRSPFNFKLKLLLFLHFLELGNFDGAWKLWCSLNVRHIQWDTLVYLVLPTAARSCPRGRNRLLLVATRWIGCVSLCLPLGRGLVVARGRARPLEFARHGSREMRDRYEPAKQACRAEPCKPAELARCDLRESRRVELIKNLGPNEGNNGTLLGWGDLSSSRKNLVR